MIINGQQIEGVTVFQDGAIQSFNCPSPEPYTTVDGSSSGWACFDVSTGTWFLNALPLQSSGTYPQQVPGYYYNQPAITPYYPYGYYPYGFYGVPSFGFGFGFGHGHGFNEHHEHGFHEHGGHGGFGHGGVGHEGGHHR